MGGMNICWYSSELSRPWPQGWLLRPSLAGSSSCGAAGRTQLILRQLDRHPPAQLFDPIVATIHPEQPTMEQPQSLRSLFATAKAEKSELETRPDTNTDRYRSDVSATIAKFEECQRLVDVLSLFSSNEPLEDISTGDLQ